MTTPTKVTRFDNDVQQILNNSFQVEQHNGHFVGKLTCGQLDRKLYEKTNKALEALGGKWSRKASGHIFSSDPRQQLESFADSGSVTVTRDGFFRTPRPVVEQMIGLIGVTIGMALEPSAGDGAIADVVAELYPDRSFIVCVEKSEQRAVTLKAKGYCHTFVEDFLAMNLFEFGYDSGFDRIFMNPPFENGQDIDHVLHAYSLLTASGAMAAIMSEGTFFRSDNKAKAFREWLASVDSRYWPLPEGTFRGSGTKVKARLVVIRRVK